MTYSINALLQLQTWFQAQCDGQWEQSRGINIETLDNPGWKLTIDLAGTALADKAFTLVKRGDATVDVSWMLCKTESQQFIGFGGAQDLTELLTVFLCWSGIDAASKC